MKPLKERERVVSTSVCVCVCEGAGEARGPRRGALFFFFSFFVFCVHSEESQLG